MAGVATRKRKTSESGSKKAAQTQQKQVLLSFRKVLRDPSPPVAAHHFFWTQVNNEYMLEFGYSDLGQLREAINKGKEAPEKGEKLPEVEVFITNRFVMGPDSIERFVGTVEKLKKVVKDARTKLPDQ